MTTPEIASVLAHKVRFNTFGGNPVCSAGGLAVLRVIDKEKRQSHCSDVGSHLLERLRALQQRHDSNYFGTCYSNWFLYYLDIYILHKLDSVALCFYDSGCPLLTEIS